MVELELGLDLLRSYKRLPYTNWHALAEFVDNSTQSYFNNKDVLAEQFAKEDRGLVVSVAYDRNGLGMLRITDNAMGMSIEELRQALRIGIPPSNTQGRSKYGLGMKMAACWYGDNWTIRTTKLGDQSEHEISIDVESVAAGNRELPHQERPAAPDDHYTIIEITNLNRKPHGRTIGKIKQYLSSMYRVDLRSGLLTLEWQGESLEWNFDSENPFVKARDNTVYRKDFSFEVAGKSVGGWVGVLERGSRSKAGFSILHANRVVRGWPESWRPERLFGQPMGSNDLVNQRLTGELHLDAFDVNHTKDDIQWASDEEDLLQDALFEECKEYREAARQSKKTDRSSTDIDVQVAVEELQAELSSSEMVDAIALNPVPAPEVIKTEFRALSESVDPASPNFTATIPAASGTLEVLGYLAWDTSSNDPYVSFESTQSSQVMIVVNMHHPFLGQVSGTDGILNYFRQCTYDGLAEWQARSQVSTTDANTIRLFKDRFMRLPMKVAMRSEG